MIDKREADKSGFKTEDSGGIMSEHKKARLEQLKSIFPEAVNSDGLLDTEALQSALGVENYVSANQGYGLNFAGKGLARIKADEPTTKELHVEKEQSKDFDKSENVIIRGDNLDVLKILRKNYEGRIKMIYIDPPYNTESANFIYKDSFKESEEELIENYDLNRDAVKFFENMLGTKTHSSWLFAMYPRLKLARDLLTDDGVIFISTDDNEQANLKILCDEIFGEECVEQYIWDVREDGTLPKTAKDTVRKEHEYIVTAFKGKDEARLNKYSSLRYEGNEKFTNPDNDPRGPWMSGNISRGTQKGNGNGTSFTITTPANVEYDRTWSITQEEYDSLLADNRIHFPKKEKGVPRKKIFQNEPVVSTQSSIFERLRSSQSASESLQDIIGVDVFDYPKPVGLLRRLVEIGADEDSICLDFFAGSGTTAEAVMTVNAQDDGSRKFVLIQWDEEIDAKKHKPSLDFCKENNMKPVISSICIERVNRSGDKVKQETGLLDNGLDIGYKVFSLVEKPKVNEDENGKVTLELFNRQSTEDSLYNMMAASGETSLTDAVEEIEPDKLYKIQQSYFVLGECKTDLRTLSGYRVYIDGYADIGLLQWLNALGLDTELVKILY
ncbi:MAG: site-specific DNA-methyltransferase [Pseudohongiellaceae bacterium]